MTRKAKYQRKSKPVSSARSTAAVTVERAAVSGRGRARNRLRPCCRNCRHCDTSRTNGTMFYCSKFGRMRSDNFFCEQHSLDEAKVSKSVPSDPMKPLI